MVAGPDSCEIPSVQHMVAGHAWAPTWPCSWLAVNAAAKSGLLTPLILVGNGNTSSALNSLGNGRLSQLLLQAPPAAGVQEGGCEERERELLLGAEKAALPLHWSSAPA